MSGFPGSLGRKTRFWLMVFRALRYMFRYWSPDEDLGSSKWDLGRYSKAESSIVDVSRVMKLEYGN